MTTAAATLERPDEAMTAKQAYDLRAQLRDEGWEPVETATDFRKTVLPDRAGEVRTVAYFPEFKNKLGGAMAWSAPGQVTAPEQASFSDVYEISEAGRWTPAD